MLTATQIVTLSCQTARVPGFTSQAGLYLNAILAELCQEYDFDAARKTFNFALTPATSRIGNLNAQLASGPFTLPVDYLRAKKGDILFFPNGLSGASSIAGFPLKLVPIDIEEFDALVQQAGFQNFPVFWVTDMSQASPVLTTTGNSHTTTTIDGLASVSGLAAGMGVAGPGIATGPNMATVISSVGASSVVLNQATLSSVTGGSFTFGNCPVAYCWPPASGAYPAMVRYYSQMPDIATPETSTAIPWFPNQQFLIQELAGRLMQLASDDRWEAFLSDNETLHPSGSRVLLRRYLTLKDDSANRTKRVTLDPRRFGTAWDRLPKSKTFGY